MKNTRQIIVKDVIGKDGGKLRKTLFPILGVIVEQSKVLEKRKLYEKS